MTPDQILASVQQNNVVASIPDDRDYAYVTRQGPFAQKLDLKPNVHEVEDQGQFNFCLDNAVVSATEMLKFDMSGSRMFVSYNRRHQLENTSGNVGGTLRNAIRSAYHWGIPDETLWAYELGLIDAIPTPEAYAQGLVRRVTRYENIFVPAWGVTRTGAWCAQFELAIHSALSEGLPVLFGSAVGEQIKKLTGPWQTHKMAAVDAPNQNNPAIGGHAMLIIGNDDTIKYPCPGQIENGSWLFQNSWSKLWGDGGFGGYPYAALNQDVWEARVIVGFVDFMKDRVPEIPYVTQPAEVLRRFWELYRRDVTDPMAASIQHYAHDPLFPTSFWNDYERIVTAKLAELRATL